MALLSLLMRAAYIYATDFPALDPWRHAALIKNILDGKGFTLFAGSPYIWYSPLWYYPAAWLGKLLGFGALELVVSSLPPILLYLLLWRSTRELRPALAAGLGTALFGPLLLYSTGLGSDGAALDLLLLALLLPEYRCGKLAYLLAGLLFGLACGMRANFIFAGLAFCRPRDWRNLPYFIIGAALPLGFVLWRNYDITSTQAFVFTWDALASRGASFNLLSAFLPGLNPEVGAANEILNQSTYLFQLYPQAFSDHAVERGLWVFSGCLAALACKDARPKLAVIGFALMFAATGFSRIAGKDKEKAEDADALEIAETFAEAVDRVRSSASKTASA